VCRYSRQVRLFLQQVKRYKTAGQALKNGRSGAIKRQVTCRYLQRQVQFFCGRSVFSIFSNDVIFLAINVFWVS
jgi:hypothetical protein